MTQTVDELIAASPVAVSSKFWRSQGAYTDFLKKEGESTIDVGLWSDLDVSTAEAAAAASNWGDQLPGFSSAVRYGASL